MQSITSTELLNRLAIFLFDLLAGLQGYRFAPVKTEQEANDFYRLNREAGFVFPPDIAAQLERYKHGGIRFIAYYKNWPVGTVRLSDPAVANRPFELYGVDPAGEHREIQNLVVAKEHRDGSQLVMLGLFRQLYGYSQRQGIASWLSCSLRNVYLTMRRYTRDIRLLDVDFAATANPVTHYLYTHQIFDTCYTMPVASFAPAQILKRHLKQKINALQRWPILQFPFPRHESFSHGSK